MCKGSIQEGTRLGGISGFDTENGKVSNIVVSEDRTVPAVLYCAVSDFPVPVFE